MNFPGIYLEPPAPECVHRETPEASLLCSFLSPNTLGVGREIHEWIVTCCPFQCSGIELPVKQTVFVGRREGGRKRGREGGRKGREGKKGEKEKGKKERREGGRKEKREGDQKGEGKKRSKM